MSAAEQLLTNNLSTLALAVQNKSASGRGSSKKIDLYGIKKLRELILELAVRGKLVPQNPEDEPASKLLESIAAEKAWLVKEGKIKKQKPLPPIGEDEIPAELPSGWGYVRLGDVINVLNGRAYKKHEMLQEGTPLLRVGNLFTSNEWYYSNLELEPEKYIDNGDLIYAWSASFGPFIWNSGKAIYHYHIWKLDLFDEPSLSKQYLYNYLLAITEHIKASGSGIAMIHMTKERMEKLVLPIPPLQEQHRIVAKVDELMALCDQIEQQTEASLSAHTTLVENLLATLTSSANAEELEHNWQRIASHFTTLFTTEASIDQLKQTILQLAVMGKLVPQDPNDEPAAKLLERIATEKAQLVKEGKIKKQKALPPIGEDEKPFELPDGWEWCRLAELVTIRGGKRVSNGYKLLREPTPYIYIRVADMKGGTIDDSDIHYIDSQMRQKISQYIITKDDIYMTIVGTIGKCGLVPDKFDQMNLTENAARLTPSAELSNSFLYKCLDSDFCQNQFIDKTKQVGVQKMALNRLASTLIPLPPKTEALNIEKKVDQLMTLCDQIKTHLQHQQQTCLHLADAMVEQSLI
ncbi:MAG: restriction endonuclease subunit S [Oceanospirillales bacterium LUC14_002_19_P2]|nr:MAG: restriction endonuclease subunit S [Oceanospirillales bacterium LUC14_002_19_P2]